MTKIVLLISVVVLTGVHDSEGQAKRRPMLSCQPRNLTSQRTLVLRFGAGHPSELAVDAPDGTQFFLVYDHSDFLGPESHPVVEKDIFRRLRELRLPAATASATPWVEGRDKNERLFTKLGQYEFILTEKLESDAGFRRFRCIVHYSP